jgi:hypothetical protein
MAWSVKYVITATCDTCGKQATVEHELPTNHPVPDDWVRTAPVGEPLHIREFCSVACLSKYEEPIPEWKQEVEA